MAYTGVLVQQTPSLRYAILTVRGGKRPIARNTFRVLESHHDQPPSAINSPTEPERTSRSTDAALNPTIEVRTHQNGTG